VIVAMTNGAKKKPPTIRTPHLASVPQCWARCSGVSGIDIEFSFRIAVRWAPR
jgi:hypothetical protein